MFVLFFCVWLVFCGKISLDVAIVGLLISAVVYWFACRFMGFSRAMDLEIVKKAGRILMLMFALLAEVFKANMRVIGWIYSAKKPETQIIRFRTDLKKELSRVALANCITLTPGTITGVLDGDTYMVHCLDKDMAKGIDESVFVRLLKELES